MPLKIIIGDILEQKSDVLVMPATPLSGPSSKFAKNIYNKAGYEKLQKERENIGNLADGEVAITPAFDLNAKYLIHASTPEWFGGFMNEPKFLAKCYYNAIRTAVGMNAKNIYFPLLGSGTNRVPPDVAQKIAVDTIQGYLRAHSYTIDVYLVIHLKMAKLLEDFSLELPKEESQFHKSNVFFYMNRDIKSIEKFANSIGCNKSTINRIMNGNTENPQKNTVILIALGLRLSKEERYDFINSSGNPYPVDERDYKLEEILDRGYKDINDINTELYNENPKWELSYKRKGVVVS